MLYFWSTNFCTTVTNNYNLLFLLSWHVLHFTICFPFHPPICLSIYLVHPTMVVHSDFLYQVSVVLLLCSLLCIFCAVYLLFRTILFHSPFFSSTDSFNLAPLDNNVETSRVLFNSATSLLRSSGVTPPFLYHITAYIHRRVLYL